MTDPVSQPDRDAIRTRVDHARPGPWCAAWWCRTGGTAGLGLYVERPGFQGYDAFTDEEVDFIIAARTDIPALLGALEAVEAERDALRAQRDWLQAGLYVVFDHARSVLSEDS